MHIVILDGFTATGRSLTWAKLESMGSVTVYDRTSSEKTIERARGAEIVLTNKVCLKRKEMEQLPDLKYIGVLATGYNVVDLEAARDHGVVVTNVPAYSTESVAQMVFAHLLTVTNRTEHYAIKNRAGEWSASTDFCYWDTQLTELSGKTIGIVGLGHIGSRVAAIAQAFGMKVVAFTSKGADELPSGMEKRSMDELLKESDVVSLHCPLTPDTHQLINHRTLQLMKPSAILINTGRGPLVNDQDLFEALKAHRLRAFCADVLTEEPPRMERSVSGSMRNMNPLLSCDNAFITPHIAWATLEARTRLIDVAVSNVKAFLEGAPVNVVS